MENGVENIEGKLMGLSKKFELKECWREKKGQVFCTVKLGAVLPFS